MQRVSVNVKRVLVRKTERRMVGINTSYLFDGGKNLTAGRGLVAALKEMGVKALRYPGGEKSDGYLWSTPPYETPRVTLGRPGGYEFPSRDPLVTMPDKKTLRQPPLDFDQFIEVCRKVKAEPTICLNYDSMHKPPQGPGAKSPSREDLLAHAVSWVRYSNITRRYGVRSWCLGNETYLGGYNGQARAADYARDLVLFSRALKAVDPTIQFGANGHVGANSLGGIEAREWQEALKRSRRTPRPDSWWKTVLTTASADIDFLDVHPYPCYRWGRYETYIDVNPNYTEAVDGAWEAIRRWAPAQDRRRLRVFATETNSADWSRFPGLPRWPHHNTLGHALVLFDLIGAHLVSNRVDMLLIWNTRWRPYPGVIQLWDALDEKNALRPTGRAAAIWGNFLGDQMVKITTRLKIPAYATYTPPSKRLSVFLINKDLVTADVDVSFSGVSAGLADRWVFSGSGPEDFYPRWERTGKVNVGKRRLSLELPPVSLTVLDSRA